MEPLDDRELDELLPEWKAPPAPPRLRSAIFPDPAPWWRRLWTLSIRVPAPVACGLAVLLALGAWRWVQPPPERVVIRTERVETPVVKIVYRDRVVRAPAPDIDIHALQPVAELRARVIRSRNAHN